MLHSISGRSYQFRTLELVYKAKPNKEDMITGLNHIINTYISRGITIHQINGDNEFACVSNDMLPARMNIMAADEHVGDVERSIRYIKEGTRTQINSLPYIHYSKSMTVGCVMYVLKHVNRLPSRSGLSHDLSPATLITGDPTPSYKEITKLKFGNYVQTKYGKTTNDQTARTVGDIALYSSGNTSGEWFFMSLLSGTILNRYRWTKMEITEDVIQWITSMAINEGQGLIGETFKYAYTKEGNDIEFTLTDEGEDEYESDLPLAITNGDDANLLAEHEDMRKDDETREAPTNGDEKRNQTEKREEPEERREIEESEKEQKNEVNEEVNEEKS